MNYSFLIRKAVHGDAGAIRDILWESFALYVKETGMESVPEALEETIGQIERDIDEKEVYIAIIDDLPVGTIRVTIFQDGSAYISRFGVKPTHHNMGIGKALMGLVDKMLAAKNIEKVSLHTASNYYALVRFYYGRGFYIDSVSKERGYARALMIKDYRNGSSGAGKD